MMMLRSQGGLLSFSSFILLLPHFPASPKSWFYLLGTKLKVDKDRNRITEMCPALTQRSELGLPARQEEVRGCRPVGQLPGGRCPSPESGGSACTGKEAVGGFGHPGAPGENGMPHSLEEGRASPRAAAAWVWEARFCSFRYNGDPLRSRSQERTNCFGSLLCWSHRFCLLSRECGCDLIQD